MSCINTELKNKDDKVKSIEKNMWTEEEVNKSYLVRTELMEMIVMIMTKVKILWLKKIEKTN